MKYTLENYEEFALDYLEGNLDPRELQEFETFLMIHPELKEELQEFTMVTLPAFSPSIPDKSKLFKRVSKKVRFPFYLRAIAAAVLILVMFVFVFNDRKNETPDEPLVQNETDVLKTDRNLTEPRIQNTVPEAQLDKISDEALAALNKKEIRKNKTSVGKNTAKRTKIIPSTKNEETKENRRDLAVQSFTDRTDEDRMAAIQPVIFINKLEIHPVFQINYQIEHRPTYMIVEEEKKEDALSKIGKFLAKANLIPDGLSEEINEIDLKERVIPESYIDRP